MKKSVLMASLVAAVALAACGKKEEAPMAAPAAAAAEAASAAAAPVAAAASAAADAAASAVTDAAAGAASAVAGEIYPLLEMFAHSVRGDAWSSDV